jgi:sugar lactone lactonase YvrE
MINSSGIISTIAGDGMEQFSGDNGPAASAEFNMYYPSGLTFDGAGNLFIADGNNYRIRKINTSGIITTVVGDGIVAGYGGDGGPATAAGLNDPTGIRFDAAGNLFIADYNNNRIRKVTNIGQASGIEQLSNHETRIEIYPNPTTRILNIESTTLDASIDMQVTDMLGQAVMQITFQQGKSSIDVSSLPSGVYFIKGSQSVQKFIKQ